MALLCLAACAGAPPPTPAPVPALPAEEVEATLYLVGDAGKPHAGGEPVLEALGRELASSDAQRIVVFLGDNIYPRGLPAPGEPDRAEAERRLAAQVETVKSAGATGYFVPGNHDWARYGKDGWESIRRQEAFIDSAGAGAVRLRPSDGCPGPSTVDLGRRVRLVMLDTQWWLHSGPKPTDPSSDCPADAYSEVEDSLRATVAGAGGRLVVVTAHHPLVSGGVHGGHFGWEDHLFPLRNIASWLWLPLPILGSLYPAIRSRGISSQDLGSRAYRRLISAFRRAFAAAPPSLYAAGHEHNLQVIAGRGVPLELVSGAGIYGHSGRAVRIKGSLFARKASGFARLDVPHTGLARLAVVEVDREGRSREIFSTWVE
jgi:calcineurin-like phosphoesterase family protein